MAGARARSTQMVLAFITWMLCSSCSSLAQTDCSNQLSELVPCLDFVTDKIPAPTTACCTSISTILNTASECLCQVAAISDLNKTRVEQTPVLCNIPFNPAVCLAGGAPTPTPASFSAPLVIVSKLLLLLSSTAAMLLAL